MHPHQVQQAIRGRLAGKAAFTGNHIRKHAFQSIGPQIGPGQAIPVRNQVMVPAPLAQDFQRLGNTGHRPHRLRQEQAFFLPESCQQRLGG